MNQSSPKSNNEGILMRTMRNKRVTTGINITSDENMKKSSTTKLSVSDKRQIKVDITMVSSIKTGKTSATNSLSKAANSSGGITNQR
jgi:hypothetical protein